MKSEIKPFIIPKSTEISGRKIKVLWNTDRVINKGLYGSTNLISGEVHIAEKVHGVDVPREEQEITYLHEIFHFILAKNGYEKKLNDAGIDLENLVEDLAVGTYQAINNSK